MFNRLIAGFHRFEPSQFFRFLFERIYIMKTKMIIGMMIACVFAVNAVQAEAVTPQKRAVKNVVNFVKKASNNIGNTIWNNKGSIAVGTAATVAVLAPDAVVQGATSIATGAVEGAATVVTGATQAAVQNSTGGNGFLSYLFLAVLFIAGLWFFVGFVRFRYKAVLPLLVLGVIVCLAGTADAATLHSAAVPVAAAIKPFVNAIGWVVIIAASIFL